MNCAQCGDLLIAPEWSEYEDERRVLHLWSCTNCGCEFETEALLPAAEPVDDAATIKAFFPSLVGRVVRGEQHKLPRRDFKLRACPWASGGVIFPFW
jgi:hypothetical protein